MLRLAKQFKNFKLRARDCDIGQAGEFYFDDENWTVRYLVADTTGWINGRQILISPYALDSANEAKQVLPLDLTKKQIEESPPLASDEPVFRSYEILYYGYYGWPIYWNGPYRWGSAAYPTLRRDAWCEPSRDHACGEENDDLHLRSTSVLSNFHIRALAGKLGDVEDVIIDDETWTIRYLVVDTMNWWAGKHVLVSPRWIDRVNWKESNMFVILSRDIVKHSPEYTPESLNREYETALHRHYNRPTYWADESMAKQH
jgi:hypothetical protein